MRSMFRRVLLALVAVTALTAVAAASASAHEWLLNEKPVTESTPITFSLTPGTTFRMKDGAGLGESLTCAAVTGKGTVGPKGAGTITEFKVSKCTRTKQGGCKSETKTEEEGKEWVKTYQLPWEMKFVGAPDEMEPVSSGHRPGWEFECTSITKEKLQDKCFRFSEFFRTELYRVSEGVEEGFPTHPETEKFSCSLGGSESGEVKVFVLLKGPEGKRLGFN